MNIAVLQRLSYGTAEKLCGDSLGELKHQRYSVWRKEVVSRYNPACLRISRESLVHSPGYGHQHSGLGEGVFAHTQTMIDELHAQPAADEYRKVLIPGEIEHETVMRSLDQGIDISETVYRYLTG